MEASRLLHVELNKIANRVWFVPGNHDTDAESYWSAVWDSELCDRNLHGTVTVLPNGLRAAGLDGVFREEVWNPSCSASNALWHSAAEHAGSVAPHERWKGKQPLKHWSTIYPADVDSLSHADVLVLHEAPGYHPHGVALLDDLALAMGVRIVVHGHHHDALNSASRWPFQGFIGHGVELRGVTAIERLGISTVIVPGELDVSRRNRFVW